VAVVELCRRCCGQRRLARFARKLLVGQHLFLLDKRDAVVSNQALVCPARPTPPTTGPLSWRESALGLQVATLGTRPDWRQRRGYHDVVVGHFFCLFFFVFFSSLFFFQEKQAKMA
jgi:hypothetical protein